MNRKICRAITLLPSFHMVRVLPRKLEAAVGRRLLRLGSRKLVKDAGLIHRSCILSDGTPVSYFEREVLGGNENGAGVVTRSTILVCHGMADEAKSLAGFVRSLNLDDSYRILVPDLPGHGDDRARARTGAYRHLTQAELLQAMIDFLLAVKVKECHAIGYSMGGAVVYFLQQEAPKFGIKVRRAVLLAPAIRACVDPAFIDDFVSRRKNHFCFENRNDVKELFRNLAPPNRKKKDPIPKFFLEACYREQVETSPRGHFRAMFQVFLEDTDPLFACEKDIDPQSERLVVWPEHEFICSYERGRDFFSGSPTATTIFHSVPDCGHVFRADGTFLLDHVASLVSEYLQKEK